MKFLKIITIVTIFAIFRLFSLKMVPSWLFRKIPGTKLNPLAKYETKMLLFVPCEAPKYCINF